MKFLKKVRIRHEDEEVKEPLTDVHEESEDKV